MRMFALLVVLMGSLFIGACTRVEPGYVGIKVHLTGTQRGVDDFPLLTGRVFYNPITEEVHKFPTFIQTANWTGEEGIKFSSTEGETMGADISLSYALDPAKVPALFVEFRQPIEQLTQVYMRSRVRDVFNRVGSTMGVMDIMGPKQNEFLQRVRDELNKDLGPKGFIFDNVSFIGKPTVSESVQKAISAAVTATQKAIEAENKVREIEALANQKIAAARGDSAAAVIRAQGEAEANRTIRSSLTSELIRYEQTRKWDGKLPQVTGNAVPMLDLNKK